MTDFLPYFAKGQDSERTGFFETIEEAVREAQKSRMAPFVIYKLVAMAISSHTTNGREAFDQKMQDERTLEASDDIARSITMAVTA